MREQANTLLPIFTHPGKDSLSATLLLDRTKSALEQTLGHAAYCNLQAGAGLATETRGVPPSDGVEERGGLGLGVDALAQLQILPGRERRDLVNIGNVGLEGVDDEFQGSSDRWELLGGVEAGLGEEAQILGEGIVDFERCGNARTVAEVLLGLDLELVGVGELGADLALVVASDELGTERRPFNLSPPLLER